MTNRINTLFAVLLVAILAVTAYNAYVARQQQAELIAELKTGFSNIETGLKDISKTLDAMTADLKRINLASKGK